MGELIVLLVKLVLYKLINMNDPKMIRWKEMSRIKHAKEKDRAEIDRALADGDTVAISELWKRLSPEASGTDG